MSGQIAGYQRSLKSGLLKSRGETPLWTNARNQRSLKFGLLKSMGETPLWTNARGEKHMSGQMSDTRDHSNLVF